MTEKQGFHEDFGREVEVKAGSERSLGVVFAGVFAIIGLFPLWDGDSVRLWALIVSGAFLALSLLAPTLLKPFNQLWFRLGQILHKVVNPVIMALLFYLTVVPTGLIMRLAGKDPLRRRFDPEAKTYWIERNPPGPDPDTMRNQF